ncbi:MAG: hypothetical protein DCO96_03650 [Fluviicola sp. XM-24bin1]|nr:MAG: hypothetical protein DCO96_03650 [Fluviicola sp. XM-24bin1]
MARVGRPKKVTRNPFVFNSTIRTRKLLVVSNVTQTKKNNGESLFETNTIDCDKNAIHISKDLLEHYCQKGADTTEAAVLLYILSKMYSGKEKIKLDPDDVSAHTGYPVLRLRRVFGKLAKAGIIKREKSRTNNYYYWINPEMIFMGNRIHYVKKQCADEQEYKSVIESTTSKKNQQLKDSADG